jgi:hypothetical protein
MTNDQQYNEYTGTKSPLNHTQQTMAADWEGRIQTQDKRLEE